MNNENTHVIILYTHHRVNINTNGKRRSRNTEIQRDHAYMLSIGSKFITKHYVNPISVIMFYISKEYNIVVDYIATNENFRGLGLEKFTIHLFQCFQHSIQKSVFFL